MYECTPVILRSFVNDTLKSSPEETDSCVLYMSVRLRSMAKKGHTSGCWRLQDLPWFIEDIEAAVHILANTGLRIFVDMNDQTVKAFWGPQNI